MATTGTNSLVLIIFGALFLSFSFSLSLLFPSTGQADEQHYRNILIGEQASGLGGAFISISDDPSGLFYNPAGIVFGQENYFSLSANAYQITTKSYGNVLGGEYEYKSSGLVPTFFGLTQTAGKFKWGFAVVVPNQDSYDQTVDLENLSTVNAAESTFRRRYFLDDRTYYFGPGVAREVAKDLTVGLSLFGVYRTYDLIDNQLAIYNGGMFFNNEHSESQETYALYPKLGAQWMPLSKISLGATLAKTYTIQSNRTARVSQINTNPALGPTLGTNGVPTTAQGNDNPPLLSPLELGIGASYFPSRRTLLTADFLYYTADNNAPDYPVQATWNVSAGMEHYLTEKYLIRCGLFTNNANTPQVTTGLTDQQDHVNLYGASAAVGMRSPGSSITLGATYSYGKGQGQAFANDPDTINSVTENSFAIYLIGSYQL